MRPAQAALPGLRARAVELPSGPPPRFTESTPANRRALEQAVGEVRKRGFAENRDEWISGLSVVSAPIFARGELRGVIAVAASTARMDEIGVDPVARRTRAAASRIGERLTGAAHGEAAR